MNKRETHIMQGMSRDLSVSRFNPNLVVDARNIRITPLKENSTLLSVTNEKGTSEFTLSTYPEGTIIGTAVIKNHLVLFTTQNGMDRIYNITFNESDYSYGTVGLIYGGNLGFDVKHPIETLAVYENENIQKVYWVDGINQPRMVNIANGFVTNGDIFNFNRKIDGGYSMQVTKYNTGGEFPAGTIQYCFNYFNKFGQETNLVDVSPLYYLCPKDKGLPADAMSTSSFEIKLSGLDGNFEYVRLYSIIRTSENAAPNVRIVGDYKIQTTQSLYNIQDVFPGGYLGSPIQVPANKLYILDISNGTKTLVSSKYPNIEDSPYTISLSTSEYLFSEVNNRVFFVYTRDAGRVSADIKANYIPVYKTGNNYCLGNDDDEWKSAEISPKVNNIIVVDNGTVGSTLDATALLFIGGQDIIAGTLTSKDNTLFLGNIKNNVPNAGTLSLLEGSNVKTLVRGKASAIGFDYDGHESTAFNFPSHVDTRDYVSGDTFYSYPINNNRSSESLKSFKAREGYRLGFIAQYNTGQWSEAIWIDDIDETVSPSLNNFYTPRGGNLTWGPYYCRPGFKAVLPQSVVNILLGAGFIRVAPVVVYPSDADRKVLYQGILASTVFNVDDRNSNSPFSQADWRFRFGYSWNNIRGELQCNPYDRAQALPNVADDTSFQGLNEYIATYSTEYYRDPSILTFHSPDIESQEDLHNSNFTDLKMRIVGVSNAGFDNDSKAALIPDSLVDTYIRTKTQGFDEQATTHHYVSGGLVSSRSGVSTMGDTLEGDTDLSFGGYSDKAIQENNDGEIVEITGSAIYQWTTYLWHRNGSLNNQAALSSKALKAGSIRYAMLDKKCISETRYGRTTFFRGDNVSSQGCVDVEINTPKLFNYDQLGVEKFDANHSTGLLYYGNIDKVVVPSFDALPDGYPIKHISHTAGSGVNEGTASFSGGGRTKYSKNTGSYRSHPVKNSGDDSDVVTEGSGSLKGKDPISMKYRSTKHLVIGLSSDSDTTINQFGNSDTFRPFWKNSVCSFNNVLDGKLENTINGYSGFYNSLFVAELYREFTTEQLQSRFGGQSDIAISNNVWTRCGNSTRLVKNNDAIIYYTEGDTYIGRYDFLKTYPYTEEDQNQIVSVYSTELESRVNLDARYDKNRGLSSNLYSRPTNFNLFNHPGYEQSNQYFTYKALDYSRYPDTFPNMLTWSLEKKIGADIDAWTSIPMTSTADAQGDLGEITNLETFNDNIYLFQPRGIAQVLFNSRVQIPTSDGQPIEITNGLKYGGLRYLSNQIGLTNKWSLATTPHGMYFIDDEKNILYQFNGQQFSDMSTRFGFNTWLTANNSYTIWNPSEYGNIRTFYDKVREDLYFVTADDALVFSEKLNTFMSFYDYNALPALVNMNDRLITFRKNSSNNLNMAWELFGGKFNQFFGTFKPYWLTFISNADPTYDKVFNNIAWRSTDYSNVTEDFQGDLAPLNTFDTLRVWNDHQDTGLVDLTDTPGKPSPIKKKFNVFRALVPRDKEGDFKGKGMNRIRNPWAYIQLSRMKENEDMLIFHDVDVDYFI